MRQIKQSSTLIKYFGFTLSEVLVTIGVIGVVAALVISAVQKYSFERIAVSRAKQTYATLSEAVLKWQYEGGCASTSSLCRELQSPVHNLKGVAPGIVKYLKIQKSYHSPTDAVAKTIDFLPDKAYSLNGAHNVSAIYVTHLLDRDQSQYAYGSYYLLNNGVSVMLLCTTYNCDFIFDINAQKPPNRRGKDIFSASFYSLGQKSFNPYLNQRYYSSSKVIYGECNNAGAANAGCNSNDGKSPLAYILTHDKLPNLKSMGYPSSP